MQEVIIEITGMDVYLGPSFIYAVKLKSACAVHFTWERLGAGWSDWNQS